VNGFLGAAFCFAWPPALAFGMEKLAGRRLRIDVCRRAMTRWIISTAMLAGIELALRLWWNFAGASCSLILALAVWWWRKRRDRVKAWLGAKSRALRDSLVRRARESARPSPVLRPSLRGAR
jgi:hypothetical protein